MLPFYFKLIICITITEEPSLRDLETAYSNFFASCQGERKGKKVKPPKFKKRKFKQSARFTDNGFTVNQHHVTLAKIGDLKVIWSRPLSVISYQLSVIRFEFSVSIIKWQVRSFLFTDYWLLITDYWLGIATFATLSTGEKIEAPKPLKKRMPTSITQRNQISLTVPNTFGGTYKTNGPLVRSSHVQLYSFILD